MEKFDFDVMLSNCISIVSQTFPDYTFICETKTGAVLRGDEERLEQVVLNFLSNAVKYSPTDKRVLIETRILDSGSVQLCITDFGVGIPKEDQPKIFEKFYRAAGSAGNFPGLGLGLYICADILQRHGASFGVKSEVGKGSTFHFSLPLNDTIASPSL
jgi:signal transduction histidine kinase